MFVKILSYAAAIIVIIIYVMLTKRDTKKDVSRDFPTDSTGDSLQRLKDSGSDLSKPHSIDFYAVIPSEQDAMSFKNEEELSHFNIEIDELEDGQWSCDCNISMIPDYFQICEIETTIELIASKYNGFSDGWGTFEVK